MRPRPWLPADDEMLRSLALRGLSENEIAAEMQRSKSSVRNHAKKANIAIARDRNAMKK